MRPGRAVTSMMKELPSGARLLVGVHLLRHLRVVDQPLVEARVLAARQHRRRDVERGIARGVDARREPAEKEARQPHAVGHRLPLHRGEHGGRRRDRLHRCALRHLAEPLLHERPGPVEVDVAGNHQTGVVGRVVLLEELHDVLVAGRRQVLHVADGWPAIGMPGRPEHLVELDRRHPVWPVLVALTPLVLHHVALPVDPLGRHRVEEVRHPVGLEEERQLQRIRRHVHDVVRAVVARRAVVVAAGRLEKRVELALLHVLRPFEHQVLEEVREAGAAGTLVGRAHVIPDVDGHDGTLVSRCRMTFRPLASWNWR